MKKNILILGCFVIAGVNAFSQDLHFSQFNENPSLINMDATISLSAKFIAHP